MPAALSPSARSLILALLNRNHLKRLGAGPTDAEEVKSHEFFANINWRNISNKYGNVRKPEHRVIVQNYKVKRAFYEEQIESLTRFVDL
jgi:serine/threonine protein kinase